MDYNPEADEINDEDLQAAADLYDRLAKKHPLETPPDNAAVQQACIVYGGNSFPGPMKKALECHLSILKRQYPVLDAAPDLFAALEAIIGTTPDRHGYGAAGACLDDAKRAAARAAITKAKGAA